MKEYDVIIIGGGPAGLTAGLYTSRDGLNSLLIERAIFGGQIANVAQVENYPGFPEAIDGLELGQLMYRQATNFGLEAIMAEATGIELQGEQKVVKTNEGDFIAKAVIIAGGSMRRKLSIPGEEKLTGKGVSYCATCDAPFFKEKPLAVVGGDNIAITEALHLAKFASRLTMIHRRDKLRASPSLQEKAFSEPKIEFLWNTKVEEIEGEDSVQRLKLSQMSTGEKSTLDVSGVFISIGFAVNTDFLKGIVPLDADDHIITNEKMETAVTGIYAAGDMRSKSALQAITAAGDGATAAIYAEKFLSK
jgi:thioredoxin reductase (NADPH)